MVQRRASRVHRPGNGSGRAARKRFQATGDSRARKGSAKERTTSNPHAAHDPPDPLRRVAGGIASRPGSRRSGGRAAVTQDTGVGPQTGPRPAAHDVVTIKLPAAGAYLSVLRT